MDSRQNPFETQDLRIVTSRQTRLAVVMGGGSGRRLGQLGRVVHKSLLPAAGAPVLEHVLFGLAQAGVEVAWIIVDHLADQVLRFVGDGKRFGLRVYYAAGASTGTAASLLALSPMLQEPFIYTHANIVTRSEVLPHLARAHCGSGALGTVVVTPFDLAPTHPHCQCRDGLITAFHRGTDGMCSVGISLLEPEVFQFMKLAEDSDLTVEEALNAVIDAGSNLQAFMYVSPWLHVEDLSIYAPIQPSDR